MIKFTLPIIPTAQSRARFTVRTQEGKILPPYKDKKRKRDEGNLCALLLPHIPETPLEGPLALIFFAMMPIPKSWPKKRQKAAEEGLERPTKVPDLDNLAKQLKDCMTAVGFWGDDKQVTSLRAVKIYSRRPCWYVELKSISEDD